METHPKENQPKKRIILRGLCEQFKKKQKPRAKLFEQLTRADVVLLQAATEGHSQCVAVCLTAGASVNQPMPIDRCENEDLSQFFISNRERQYTTALIKASEKGHHECLSLLIESGADVNWAGKNAKPALLYAISAGHPECVKLLLKAGANVNIATYDYSPVYTAIRSFNFSSECFSALIKAGADVNEINKDYGTLLLALISRGHAGCMEPMIKAGADINETNEWKETALHLTAKLRHIVPTELLIRSGADVNVRDYHGNTALMKAASAGCTEIVHILIEAGADVKAWNKKGETSLMLSASERHALCLQTLIRVGADVNSQNCKGMTALMGAASNEESLRSLIEAGANIDSQNCEGWTALMYAVNNENSLKCLIEAGADVNKKNNEVETALKLAFTKDSKCFNQLLKAGADVNTRLKDGNTTLSLATMHWRSVPVRTLIAAGANVRIVDFSRNTLLHKILGEFTRQGQHCSKAIQCIKCVLADGTSINMLNIEYKKALNGYFQLRDEGIEDFWDHMCLCDMLDESESHGYVSSRSVCSGTCEAELLTLLLAAGETVDGDFIDIRDYLEPPWGISLSHMCRETIREHMLQVDPHGNLFYRAQQLGLPSVLQQYLVYNVSLNDEDINNNTKTTDKDLIPVGTDIDEENVEAEYLF